MLEDVIQQTQYSILRTMLFIMVGIFLLFMILNLVYGRQYLVGLEFFLLAVTTAALLNLKKIMISRYSHIFTVAYTSLIGGVWLLMSLIHKVSLIHFMWIFAIPIIFYLINGIRYGLILTSSFVVLTGLTLFIRYPESANISLFSWINILIILATSWGIAHFYEKNNIETKTELVGLTKIDELTDLKNRNQLYETYREYKHKGVCMVVLDIESLKSINNKYGHLAGDVVLMTIAKIMTDRQSENAQVFRTGGDEFAMLIPEANCDDCLVMTRNIFADICDCQTVFKNDVIPLEVSIALACIKSDGNNLDTLMNKADELLKQAKLSETDKIAMA